MAKTTTTKKKKETTKKVSAEQKVANALAKKRSDAAKKAWETRRLNAELS